MRFWSFLMATHFTQRVQGRCCCIWVEYHHWWAVCIIYSKILLAEEKSSLKFSVMVQRQVWCHLNLQITEGRKMFLYVKGHWKFGIMLRLNKKRVESKELPKPANKSYEVGSNVVHNKLNIAVIVFFCSVPSILQPFLLNFQTDKPMVPFLDVDLFSVFKTLMRKFIKPEVCDSTQTSIKLLRIDVNDKSNQVNYKKINIGLLLNKASENQKQVKGRLWNLTGARCSCGKSVCSWCDGLSDQFFIAYVVAAGFLSHYQNGP